jgi:hypothetical protein
MLRHAEGRGRQRRAIDFIARITNREGWHQDGPGQTAPVASIGSAEQGQSQQDYRQGPQYDHGDAVQQLVTHAVSVVLAMPETSAVRASGSAGRNSASKCVNCRHGENISVTNWLYDLLYSRCSVGIA